MAHYRGMGGWLVVRRPLSTSQGLLQHCAIYEVVTAVDVRTTVSAGCLGWVEGLPKVRRVESAMFRVAENDQLYTHVLGFTEGNEFPVIYLKDGEKDRYSLLTRSLVTRVRKVVDAKKAVWMQINLEFGVFARDVVMPLHITG